MGTYVIARWKHASFTGNLRNTHNSLSAGSRLLHVGVSVLADRQVFDIIHQYNAWSLLIAQIVW